MKYLALHSQSKNGLQKISSLAVKKGETSGLKVHNLVTYRGCASGKVL